MQDRGAHQDWDGLEGGCDRDTYVIVLICGYLSAGVPSTVSGNNHQLAPSMSSKPANDDDGGGRRTSYITITR